jgi:aryl-alcohol dehydrogenase-like predicted oxidoreductase
MKWDVSPASVALARQIAQPSITAPIASATTANQVHELVAATKLNLDKAAIEQLDTASNRALTVGQIGGRS